MMRSRTVAVLLLCMLSVVSLAGCRNRDVPVTLDIYTTGDSSLMSRTAERYFEVYQGGAWEEILVKGINIGTSLPGGWYTQFPANRALYRSWLEDIARLNVNVVRLYTLLDPAFYQVFHDYNSDPQNAPIWLLQEIWPHDEVPDLNFHEPEYKETYRKEVRLVVDALHGNAQIAGRPHRAYGNYSADISPFVLGLLIGREFEPDEVRATDALNPQLREYLGDFVVARDASPTEVWLAELCDVAMEYAQDRYGWQYPVGFVSWPTLDPLYHATEWEAIAISASPAYNDREEVRPDRFSRGVKNIAGFFGAYHIYPNYPDFMNMEPGFAEFADDEGSFRYIGYLHDFMSIHPAYPAVVAEFGISTSLNTAHLNPDGLNHGGLSEEDQGEMTVRMMKAIVNEGYAGGIIFEWTDEWAKKTWNTEPYMVPWERQVLWKNAMDPEQNYGILSMEPDRKPFQGLEHSLEDFDLAPLPANPLGQAAVTSLSLDVDEAFLYLSVGLGGATGSDGFLWDDFGLMLGIDTFLREAGEFKLPIEGVPILPTGVEFLLNISSPKDASMLVIPSYNRAEYAFAPAVSQKGIFARIEPVVNRERITRDGRTFPALRGDQSRLNYGQFDTEKEDYYSLAHWYADEDLSKIEIRLPWMLLNVSDPSSAMVMYDKEKHLKDPLRDQLEVVRTEGFVFYVATYSSSYKVLDYQPRQGSTLVSAAPYLWETWEEPSYKARLKKSFAIIAEYFGGK